MSGTLQHQGAAAPFLMHSIHVDDIPAAGLDGKLKANERERRAIADALDLVSLDSLELSYTIRPQGRNRFKLTGNLTADSTQSCVVSLEPVRTQVSEEVALEFWPAQDLARLERPEDSDDTFVDLDGPEPFEAGTIDLGQLLYELFAAALDPYPRKEGASFDWKEAGAGKVAEKQSPFAALETLKNKKH